MATQKFNHGIPSYEYGAFTEATSANAYADILPIIPCGSFKTKCIELVGTVQTVKVKVLGSIDGGVTFSYTGTSDAVLAANATLRHVSIPDATTPPLTHIKVQVASNAAGTHGKLNGQYILSNY